MALKKSQLERLQFLVWGNWAEDWLAGREPRTVALQRYRDTLAEMESSEELHQLAWNYNWDDGVERLEWVTAHPICDQGTALLIFWLGEPAWHYRFRARKDVPDWARPVWSFLQQLCAKYLDQGFLKQTIKTDPMDIDRTNYLRKPKTEEGMGLYRIPYGMCIPSPGRPVKRISL